MIKGLDDKREVAAFPLSSVYLPPQVLYKGVTEETVQRFVDEVIVPYVTRERDLL